MNFNQVLNETNFVVNEATIRDLKIKPKENLTAIKNAALRAKNNPKIMNNIINQLLSLNDVKDQNDLDETLEIINQYLDTSLPLDRIILSKVKEKAIIELQKKGITVIT